jgi:hypothetical protein
VKNKLTMLRIDPGTKTIATIQVRIGKNATAEVRRLCRAKKVGWREVISVGDAVLTVAGGVELDEATPGWRLPGGEDSAGICIVFGKGAHSGGMADCPVSADWLRERIIWVAGEDLVQLKERAEAMLPSLPPEIRNLMAAAMPNPGDGSMWLPVSHEALFEPVLALGLSTPSSGGQRLSPVGVEIHNMLIGASE